MSQDPSATQLNDFLRNKLESASCTSGRLECRITGTHLLSLRGTREDGKPMLFWDLDRRPLPRLIDDYLAAHAPQAAALIIDIDLEKDLFRYEIVSGQQIADRAAQEKRQQEAAEQHRLQEMKDRIGSQQTPYGRELAEEVAAALDREWSLGYSHRDYCGMGLDKDSNGSYCYGELWDGGMLQPEHTFPDRNAFVNWLAVQSDASMARLESKETFYWNNQVINRARLEAFVQGEIR